MYTRSGKKSSTSTNNGSTSKKVKLNEDHDIQGLQDAANKLRILSMKMTNASNSGHPTSCCSMADFLAVLFFDKSGKKEEFHKLSSCLIQAKQIKMLCIKMTTIGKFLIERNPLTNPVLFLHEKYNYIYFSLFFQIGMRIQATDPRSYTADRLVLSKGHTAPILYAAWSLAGLYTEE